MANPILLPRRLYAVAGLLFFASTYAYSQDILWEKSYGGVHAEYLMDAVPTADYGFILAGSSLSGKSGNKSGDNIGDLDYWIWKMDEKGELEWQKSFGGSGTDFLQSIKLTVDGGFILAGNSNSNKSDQKKADSHGDNDFWIIKLNAGGGEEWQQTIGGNSDERLNSICQTRDGGYILGGSSSSDPSFEKTSKTFGNMDYWIVKLDKRGKVEWEETFGGKYFDELRSIEQTRDGGYILGGYSNSPQSGNKFYENNGVGDYYVIKLDKDGNNEWEKVIGGDKDDQLYTVHQTYDGGFILGGNSNSSASFSKSKGNGKGTDFWVVKLKADGEMDWQETYDFGTSDILTSIVENKDHTFLVGGFAKSEPGKDKDSKGINDYIALKISEKGENLWDTSVGSDGDDALRKLIETRDGGYLLAGTSNPVRTANLHKSAKNKAGKSSPVKLGSGQPNQQLQNTTNKANDKMKEATDSFNEAFDETMGEGVDKINKAAETGDSALQMGVNKPKSPVGKSPSLGNGGSGSGNGANDAIGGLMDGIGGGKTNGPASGDKKRNFGSNDFWVVKLKDKNKSEVKKGHSLEAMPNPTESFTNVIVNYEFENGTATVVDISGHVLETFAISSRTVPVDLSSYPEGIYVVNIKTNVGSDGVKVIKRGN